MPRRLVLLLLLGIAGLIAGAQERAADRPVQRQAILLDRGWQFRQLTNSLQSAEEGWMPAAVPGDVHLDLIANKVIPDPFYRDNESKLQWIETANWEYRTTIDASPVLLARANIELVFEGLDSLAQVYLNGDKILEADNSFRTWRVPVKSKLKAGANQLRVVFPSPITSAKDIAARDPWQAKTGTEPKTYIRKAAYQYGWDWGPRFVTSGIWRPVRLESWDQVRIADFAVRQHDVTAAVAHLSAQVELEASTAGPANVSVAYTVDGKPARLARDVMLHAGSNRIEFPIEIAKPRLWYPAGYGDQALYDFTTRVTVGRQIADERSVKTGLRSVVLDRSADQWGRSFQFVVNGIPVFAKGANVIPFDSFPTRVTVDDYRRILQSARDANMNMIRVWGGGYYGTDDFYEICDQLGIMVWQDFMFGNDWQPGTFAFKQNVEAEAEDQVRRLRNHPSIVLWCGNNETEEAFNWGTRWQLPADVRLRMWQDYLTQFSGILDRVVARLEPEIPYWPSSPSSDYETTSENFVTGDMHDWGVWHGRVPFTDYEKHLWRFVSEFGFQSFPEMRTIESFTQAEDRTGITTPIMLAHQKNNEGNSILHDYMTRDYPEPKDFASFVYVSQVLQAEGIKIGAEHFRRSRPATMGALYWQLNDCWPVASWSSIDYYGRWKALQYYARRFYAPVLVSPHIENGVMKVYAVSDLTVPQSAQLLVALMDFDGKVLLEDKREVTVAPLTSQVVLEWPLDKISVADGGDPSRVFISAKLIRSNGEIARNLIYLAPTKDVRLKPAALDVQAREQNDRITIRISSPVLARDVYLSFGNLDVKLSDNYFDLLPGETVEITATGAASLDGVKGQMRAISLTDAFAASGQQSGGHNQR